MYLNKRKFKVGDRVRILPSAASDGVASRAFNKTGKIITTDYHHFIYAVYMDNEQYNNGGWEWVVSSCNLIPSIRKGQQLLFPFMSEEV